MRERSSKSRSDVGSEVGLEFEAGSDVAEEEFEEAQVPLRSFILTVQQPNGGEATGLDALGDICDVEGGAELCETLGAEVRDGQLVVQAADIETLQNQLDELPLEQSVDIWRSAEDIGEELPEYTVGTMKAINIGNTVNYPYNFSEEDFARAQDYFAEVGYHGNLEEARTGFADPRYFEKSGRFTWTSKPNVSAAQAIESFVNLAGENPVIAECQTTAQAVEYYAILKTVGRRRFDAQLGSAEMETPADQRLRLQFNLDPSNPIKQLYESPRIGFDEEELENVNRNEADIVSAPNFRPAKRGGRYFIEGPTGYVKRHPEGFLRGENAFYYGKEGEEQRFGGLGIENETELGITEILAGAFNAPPTETEAQSHESVSERERESGLYEQELPPSFGLTRRASPPFIVRATCGIWPKH